MLVLANILVSGLSVTSGYRMLFMLPLCMCIAVVYKTLRCDRVAEVPVAAFVLWLTIVFGMYAVGVGLWLIFLLLA